MANDKVFVSEIWTHNVLKNNLYELLHVESAKPISITTIDNLTCDFSPKTDKYFVPKKKIRVRVRTVRDIRNLFENDIYSTLEDDLEKQQNILFRKIRGGSSKDEKTRTLATNILKSDTPISRVAWQMLINVNPNDHTHASQYVLWNGKCIQVNGSRGGKYKFICRYDLGARRPFSNSSELRKSNSSAVKSLLRNSSSIKFKPGPLSKKKYLDISYQKYNFGNVELAQLPNPGLDVIPEYGKPLESSITNYLNTLRDENGLISDKWAEFAVSTLGKEDNGRAVQLNKETCVTFNLKYKNEKSRLLMRRSNDNHYFQQSKFETLTSPSTEIQENETKQEIRNMLDEMITSVEITLLENNLYTGIEPPRCDSSNCYSKDKLRKGGELNMLGVTIIRISDAEEKNNIENCRKSFCSLGCICDSLASSFRLKKHCGRMECMFECKCDFSKYNYRDIFDDDHITSLVYKGNNLKLSKEEQKFHQTVILSGEKSIVLKSQRRNWKAPKKYADFYSSMCLKSNTKTKRILSVFETKLNCANIEPWCMVHNLYKCFCKGKFKERSLDVFSETTKALDDNSSQNKLLESQKQESSLSIDKSSLQSILRPRTRQESVDKDGKKIYTNANYPLSENCDYLETCARLRAYKRRKYHNNHYLNVNKRIREMEENDTGIRKRMQCILNTEDVTDNKKAKKDSEDLCVTDLKSTQENKISCTTPNESPDTTKPLTNDVIAVPDNINYPNKLKSWLEPILKNYRQRFSEGFYKKSLDPPKAGKIALYPWDFILERYSERKNYFLVTANKPFRIFMAVDCNNTIFKNCINIKDIVDVDKYPPSVKNLIENKSDGTDSLCILRGLNFCWEFFGSLKKMSEIRRDANKSKEMSKAVESLSTKSLSDSNSSFEISIASTSVTDAVDNISTQNPIDSKNSSGTSNTGRSTLLGVENNSEQSKWFVMTLENDFSEIQFYNRGFFVKYESIIKAINVARASDKTVRLSSQKRLDGNGDPQFGIYAIPNANEYCVFIGPYEKNEPLGIETMKTPIYYGQTRTRGVWITTNKIDNFRVIDNPLSFMEKINLDNEEVLVDSVHENTNMESASCTDDSAMLHRKSPQPKVVKTSPKPIRIRKTNNFYHLTSSGHLKPVSHSTQNQISPFVLNRSISSYLEAKPFTPLLGNNPTITLQSRKHGMQDSKTKESTTVSSNKPIAEIAPQIKIRNNCSESNSEHEKMAPKKNETGMFILKPEEINQRSFENKLFCMSSSSSSNDTLNMAEVEMNMDIENFLANNAECIEPSAEVYVISDDEDNYNIEDNQSLWSDVGLVCNIENMGWISGRQNASKYLSFEFPGFKFTEFYPEEEALEKINQVLSRKIYVPKNLELKWSITEIKNLTNKKKLMPQDLGPDYMLTKQGLVHKLEIIGRINKRDGNNDLLTTSCVKESSSKVKEEEKVNTPGKDAITKLESESNLLEEESNKLFSNLLQTPSNTFFDISNDARKQMSERLQSIISSANKS